MEGSIGTHQGRTCCRGSGSSGKHGHRAGERVRYTEGSILIREEHAAEEVGVVENMDIEQVSG